MEREGPKYCGLSCFATRFLSALLLASLALEGGGSALPPAELWLSLALFGVDENPDDATADSATDPEQRDDRSG